jgi:hypothetical protein
MITISPSLAETDAIPNNSRSISRSSFGTDTRIGYDIADYNQDEPYIHVAKNGYIYVAWEDFREGNWDIFFSRSVDGGVNWDLNLPVQDGTVQGTYQRSPAIVTDSSNFLYMVYEENRNGDWDIYFTKSPDNGDTWSTQTPVNSINDIENTFQFNPSIAIDKLNNLYVAWTSNTTTSWDIYISRSTDYGATWSAPIKANDDTGSKEPEAPSVSIDADGANNVYVVWEDNREGTNDIYFSYSNNSLESFTSNIKVNDGLRGSSKTVTAKHPEIKVNSRGDIYVVWDEEWNSLYNIYFSKSLNHGISFDIDVRINGVVDECFPGPWPSLDLDNKGNMYVTWIDRRNNNHTYFAGSTDGGLSFFDNTQVDDTDETPVPKAPQLTYSQLEKSRPNIAVSNDGSEVYIVWSDFRNDQLPSNEISENSDIYFDKTSTYADRKPSSPMLGYNLIGSTYVELKWSINSDPDFSEYLLYTSTQPNFDISSKTYLDSVFERSSTSYNLTGLSPTTTYYYKLRVQDINGKWNDTNELKITTIENEAPLIALVEPDGVNDMTDANYYIRWIDSDPDDNATIRLYYDTNAIEGGEVYIDTVPQGEDSVDNTYYWNTTNISNGEYFIKAVIVDPVGQMYSAYSSGRLKIHHGELIPPEIVLTGPEDEEVNVSVSTEIFVVFNEPLDITTITSTNFYVLDSSMNNVGGNLSYDNTSNKVMFSPNEKLNYEEPYRVILTTGIRDQAENALESGLSWTFTTEIKIAQRSVVLGLIRDKADNSIIPNVQLSFQGVDPDDHNIETELKYSTITDNSGSYEIEVMYGVYRVTITAKDYQILVVHVNLSTNLKNLDFHLTKPVITRYEWEDEDGDEDVLVDEVVEFNAEGFDYENDTLLFVWNFGDGSSNERGEKVTHKFSKAGEYEITLTVTDLNGGNTTITTNIKVEEPSVLGIDFILLMLFITILIIIVIVLGLYTRKLKKDRKKREEQAFKKKEKRVPLMEEEEEEEDILASEEEEDDLPPVKPKGKGKAKPKAKTKPKAKKAVKKQKIKKKVKVAKRKSKK